MGKEFADSIDPGLYEATPPVEAMRVILSRAATTQDGQKRKVVMTNDVRRAYFNASVTREVYVEIPADDKSPEDGDVVNEVGKYKGEWEPIEMTVDSGAEDLVCPPDTLDQIEPDLTGASKDGF